MSITVQPSSEFSTKFASISNLKFSTLRDVFKSTANQSYPVGIITNPGVMVSASELLRNVIVIPNDQSDPIVPDATENSGISSTRSNWKFSQFKNSIKFYVADQFGSDNQVNLNSGTVSWNGNLIKSIRKFITIRGEIYSTNQNIASLRLTEDSNNVNIIMYSTSRIYGTGGFGGTANNGADGGNAVQLISSLGKIKINLLSGTNVYGGGGGGAKGVQGTTGSGGACQYNTYVTVGPSCGGCPGCPGGFSGAECYTGPNFCPPRNRGPSFYHYCVNYNNYTYPGGAAGGAGGNGAHGRGWNNLNGTLIGVTGSAGSYGACGGGLSGSGENGGNSGDWGLPGTNTTIGIGGFAGRAITGSNYQIEGVIDASTLKGLYNI